METPRVAFDAWLRECVAARGSSGSSLARQLAVPTLTVYQWLHGLALPNDAMAARLADVLGTTISEVRVSLERGVDSAQNTPEAHHSATHSVRQAIW